MNVDSARDVIYTAIYIGILLRMYFLVFLLGTAFCCCDNDMIRDDPLISSHMKVLLRKRTTIEETLLSHFLPVISVFKLMTGQNIHRGYVKYLQKDEMHRLADKIPVVTVKHTGQKNTSVECKLNLARVQAVFFFCYITTQKLLGGILQPGK